MTETKITKNRWKNEDDASGSPAELQYVFHPSFERDGIERELWGGAPGTPRVRRFTFNPDCREDGAAEEESRALSAVEERLLFLRYNYAKYRCTALRKNGAAGGADGERWFRRATRAHRQIIHANLPLVPAMARQKKVEGFDFQEQLSEGYTALLRCIEKFDVSRGFKFSTYACKSIHAAFCRMGTKLMTYRKHVPARLDDEAARGVPAGDPNDRRRTEKIASVRTVLDNNLAGLKDPEQEVIRQRYPVGTNRRSRARWRIGRELGVSPERIRQIERKALEKIRRRLDGGDGGRRPA